jgi:glycine cleavage system H protein
MVNFTKKYKQLKTMNIPENLLFTQDHEWIAFEDGLATVGISEYAQGELGDVVFVEIETLGETLGKGDIFGTVEAVKTVSDLFMPVSGEVVEVNSELADKPELINKDPFGSGWMIRIKLTDPGELSSLLTPDNYRKMIEG